MRCPGGHQHVKIQGSLTKGSAIYTWPLAKHLALYFARALRRSRGESADEVRVDGYESLLINDLLITAKWESCSDWHWRAKSHINVLESNSGQATVVAASRELRSSRFVCILDSRVAKGALAKGRSSSTGLQRVCKRSGVWQLVTDTYPGWCFGPTRLNIADDPTRDQPLRGPSGTSLSAALSPHDLQFLHSRSFSKPVANLLRLVFLVLLFGGGEAEFCGGQSEARIGLIYVQEIHGIGVPFPFAFTSSATHLSSFSPINIGKILFSAIQPACLWIFIGFTTWIFAWTFRVALKPCLPRFCLVLSCLVGPLGWTSGRDGFGPVLAAAMEPISAAERLRAAQRSGGGLIATRVARKATIDNRRKLLDDFRVWLWENHGIQLSYLLTAKPPDAEEICRCLVAYGQDLYRAGKAYGKYAESINAVATARPAIRKMLSPAWDLAFAWLEDEPYQHHPALPLSIMLSILTLALFWGWPTEAAIIGLTWAGLLRIGETLQADRSDLTLPEDAAPGTDFALLRIRTPKTRGRAARHQAAKIDFPDIIQLLTAVFGNLPKEAKLWPYSAATLRKRFASLLGGLGLPTVRQGGKQPFSLGSLRPGGATFLLLRSEDSEFVRRRGRWVTAKVCEIYLQEVLYTTYTEKLPAHIRRKIQQLSTAFPETLQVSLSFLQTGIPKVFWNRLFQARDHNELGRDGIDGGATNAASTKIGQAAEGLPTAAVKRCRAQCLCSKHATGICTAKLSHPEHEVPPLIGS